MAKKKTEIPASVSVDLTEYGGDLLAEISSIIDLGVAVIRQKANSGLVLMFWDVGNRIQKFILENKRADYGKQIVATLSQKLHSRYGVSFEKSNLHRMIKFAEIFSDREIVVTLSPQLSWSHILAILPLKTMAERLYYAQEMGMLGVRDFRRAIAKKAYERKDIANLQLSPDTQVPFNTFKDPYLLDTLGLAGVYSEADLEEAILKDLESFILEFGKGFSFIKRQKRMIIDGKDFYLDLLFYQRDLKRLVAVELKIGEFKAAYKGQMELYLGWLDRYERRSDENAPIGVILCAETQREQIELLNLDKAGIAVAEYWTVLPPKKEFEKKLQQIMIEAKERLERRKLLGSPTVPRQIETFVEYDDEEE